MKKLVLVLFLLMTLCACHVRHDHSKHVQQVRIVLDTTQKSEIQTAEEIENEDESDALLDIPDIPEEFKAEAHPESMREMEQMLEGKDTRVEP